MPQSSKPDAKRRHVTTACISCRESKIKIANSATAQRLRVPIAKLSAESVVTKPERTSANQLPLDFTLPFDPSSFNLGNDVIAGHVPPVQDESLNLTTRAIADWEWSPSENADNIIATGVGVASVRTPSHPLLSTYSEDAALSDNGDDDAGSGTTEEDLVNQLSDRLGSLQIGPNGRISYFGPTSNFSLMELPVGADTLAMDRTVRNDGQEHLDNMGYGKQVPQDLEDHLINLYFTWQDPFQHVVDRTLYEEAKHSWHEREEDTPYYSEALRNAMYIQHRFHL
ncbi:hypothetical protein COL5a_006181 [Colletotrichum fioriniae]|nr:hypothetical protein COL5a_006181 [Colletotrichum fioriniae]